MRVLVTGGLGYVGGRLAKHLASSGHEIFIGSRTLQPKPIWLKKGSLVVMDWSNNNNLLKACKNIDLIIHAAGMNARECSENPELALQVNGIATKNLVSAASKQLVSKFIYISSAHVYTDNLSGVISEQTIVSNSHPYATSQIAGEQATINGHSNIAMQTIVVRLANAIGAPVSRDVNCWKLVVNDLCKQAALKRQLVIKSPSNGVRNFISMTDVCLALEFLMNNNHNSLNSIICNMGDKTKSIGSIASDIRSIYIEDKGVDLGVINLSDDRPDNQHLDFQSSVLADMGYQWSSNFRQELHELVNFCELEFGTDNEN